MTFNEKVLQARNLIEEWLHTQPNGAVALSFGKDSMVLLHLAMEVDPSIPVFAVLGNTEFDETLEFRDRILLAWRPEYTEYLFENGDDPAECCRSVKVDKFKKAVSGLDMWFSGIRRDEGWTRTDFQLVEELDGLIKVNPILNFTEKDVWRYTALYGIPVNPVYLKGYRSLSCVNCSVPEQSEEESERAGRWQGTEHEGGECGIHTRSLR